MIKNILKVVLAVGILSLLGCNEVTKPTDTTDTTETDVRTVLVTNGEELAASLADAQPGDVIALAEGDYTVAASEETLGNGLFVDEVEETFTKSWFFGSQADGTAEKRITLRSADPENPAVVKGAGWQESGYALYIRGDYWTIENLVVSEAAKGIMFDHAGHSILNNVEIHTIGQEGLHYRDGSHTALADEINIHDVGKLDDGFGEGIYIGSDLSVWKEEGDVKIGLSGKLYSRDVYNITVKNSVIGPNITAEPFDVKEGTFNIIIEDNTIYGSGISGQNFADSFIDLKGTMATVRRNVFDYEENTGVSRGVHIVPRNASGGEATGVDFEFTGRDNFVYDNEFILPSTVRAGMATGDADDIYMWNNLKVPHKGELYSSKINHAIPESTKYLYEGTQTVSITVHSTAAAIEDAAKVTVVVSENDDVIASVDMEKAVDNSWSALIELAATGTYALEATSFNAQDEVLLVSSANIDAVRFASAEFVNFAAPVDEEDPVPSVGLLHAWSFDDESLTAQTGGATLAPTSTSPFIGYVDRGTGKAVDVNQSGYFTVSNDDALDFGPGETFTIAFWIKKDGVPASGYPAIFDRTVGGTTDRNGYRVMMHRDNGTIRFRGYNNGASVDLNGSVNVTDNAWHHVAVVHDGANATIYVDGVVDAASSPVLVAKAGSSNLNVVGLSTSNTTNNIGPAQLDEIRIYDTALSVEEVAALAQ